MIQCEVSDHWTCLKCQDRWKFLWKFTQYSAVTQVPTVTGIVQNVNRELTAVTGAKAAIQKESAAELEIFKIGKELK